MFKTFSRLSCFQRNLCFILFLIMLPRFNFVYCVCSSMILWIWKVLHSKLSYFIYLFTLTDKTCAQRHSKHHRGWKLRGYINTWEKSKGRTHIFILFFGNRNLNIFSLKKKFSLYHYLKFTHSDWLIASLVPTIVKNINDKTQAMLIVA